MDQQPLSALRTAFDAMMSVVPVERRGGAAPRPGAVRRGRRRGIDKPAARREIASRLGRRRRGVELGSEAAHPRGLEVAGQTLRDLSEECGVPLGTLEKVLSPKGSPPGAIIAGRLSGWLAAQGMGETPMPSPAEASAIADSPEPIVVEPPAFTIANGHIGPGRLTVEQRNKLAGFAQLDAPVTRQRLGMNRELMDRAIGGAELPGEGIERVAAFLAGR